MFQVILHAYRCIWRGLSDGQEGMTFHRSVDDPIGSRKSGQNVNPEAMLLR
jgi:hypothetical protein